MKHALTAAAMFAMAWVVVRAAHQAITIDEATTFVGHVQNGAQWAAGTNNHLLNTLLMRFSTTLFGVSEFTVRLPALVGAALYIAAARRLCGMIATLPAAQLIAFLCLVYNPFIMDHLVAARGYGLALAFLLWAIVVGRAIPSPATLALAASLLALCFTANFSFAFTAAATFFAILIHHRRSLSLRLWAAAVMPPAAITLIFPASILLDLHGGDFWYGSTSVAQIFSTVIDATLYRINPNLANPTVARLFTNLKPVVLPLAAATSLLYLGYLLRGRVRHANLSFALMLASIAAGTLALHLIAYHAFGVLLPRDRTAIFFVPLLTTAAAAIAAIPAASRQVRYFRNAALSTQALLAIYFLFCLRLDYFKEWQWNAETDRLYSVLSCLHREHGVENIAAGWPFAGALNFYRAADASRTFAEVIDQSTNPAAIQAYALDPFLVPGVVEAKNLTVIYRAPTTNGLVAVPPAHAGLAHSPCVSLK